MNRVKLRFVAKKRVKHYFLFFEKITLSSNISFEFVEEMLDILIEHIFHTDLHNTQIIVFYLMLSIAGYGLYKLYKLLRTMPRRYREFKENLVIALSQLNKEILVSWQDLPPTGKAKWYIGFMVSISCIVLWVFI